MTDGDKSYLIYISEAITSIETFTKDGKDTFMKSDMVHSAVMYKLQTLAETTQRLSDDLKSRHEQMDWSGISGFRNRLVHGYMAINLEVVWSIIVTDLVLLKSVVTQELKNLDTQ